MFQFIESICCQQGDLINLHHHQTRINQTFEQFYPNGKAPILAQCLKPLKTVTGTSKIRFLYNRDRFEYTIQPYDPRLIKNLKIVFSDSIEYRYKFLDRSALTQLYLQRGDCDDILIIKNGLVTDTYYANVVFFDGARWLTPSQPLLLGTRRQQLLESGQIEEVSINQDLIKSFQKVSLVNAMLDLGQIELAVSQIH